MVVLIFVKILRIWWIKKNKKDWKIVAKVFKWLRLKKQNKNDREFGHGSMDQKSTSRVQ